MYKQDIRLSCGVGHHCIINRTSDSAVVWDITVLSFQGFPQRGARHTDKEEEERERERERERARESVREFEKVWGGSEMGGRGGRQTQSTQVRQLVSQPDNEPEGRGKERERKGEREGDRARETDRENCLSLLLTAFTRHSLPQTSGHTHRHKPGITGHNDSAGHWSSLPSLHTMIKRRLNSFFNLTKATLFLRSDCPTKPTAEGTFL